MAGIFKKIVKKVLNPLAPINAVGKAADFVADKTGLGDNLGKTKVGKVLNYVLNPVAQSQGVRDASEPVKEYAEQHPDHVKLLGNVVQCVGAGVALVFPPVGAVISAAGTGIVYASKAIETKNTISSIPQVAQGVKTAIKNKDYKLALLSLAYLATQGENIASDLKQLRLTCINDGKLSAYENYFSQLAQISGNSAIMIEKAQNVYNSLLNDVKNGESENIKVTEKAVENQNGEYIAVEISENQPLIIRFLRWFFGI